MVGVDYSSLQAYSRPKSVAWFEGRSLAGA